MYMETVIYVEIACVIFTLGFKSFFEAKRSNYEIGENYAIYNN